MINLTWLHTFCTLIETGHFTRTADKLVMTQPGVSQHVQKLEQSLGCSLIQREGKGFHLTEAGEKVYRQGLISISQLKEMEESLKTDDPYRGRCRIATPGSVGLKLFPALLEWQKQHTGLQVDFSFAPNNSIEQGLEDRKLDIGLITRRVKKPGLTCRPMAAEHLCLVTSVDVPKIDWPTLLELGYINHPDGEHHATLLLGANYPEFIKFDQLPLRGFSNQIAMILEPVSRGLGFTVLPAHAVAAFPHQHLIYNHRLNVPVSETIYLAQQKWDALPKRMNKVIELITHELTQSI
ncbi:LysR family transcriptional regulator [Parendozoicomonas sp. Alg238-R29]|uniref:LysR family transcriptional regulator n=1 Tax=Parendozoicomonas sp. Alg238-R29 TaxID=2993446 RepID=UPI00248E4242|nr:LysR family transcriptional regulator [Parendozoicomonas sp. Alg238-R29]